MSAKTWKLTSGSASWSTATDWTPSAPVAGDAVLIGTTRNAGNIVVTENATVGVGSLTMAGLPLRTTTLSITPTAALTVTGPVALGANTTINGTGTLTANGAISGAGTIAATSGLLDLTGSGAIAGGGPTLSIGTAAASTLEVNLGGGVNSAPIQLTNAHQTLEVGPAGKLTIGGVQNVTAGTILMAGGTLSDSSGVTLGSSRTSGSLIGSGTVAANLARSGSGSADTVTASGGTLDLLGTVGSGVVIAIATSAPSDLKIDSTATAAIAILVSTAAQTLEIGATGVLTLGAAENTTGGTILLDGGTLADPSTIGLGSLALLTGHGTVAAGISGAGTVKASGGALTLKGNETAAATTLDIDSVAGSALVLAGTVVSGARLAFLGASGVLELADVANGAVQHFNGTIAGLAVATSATVPANAVNIQATVTSATLAGNTITVTNGTTTVATLALSTVPAAGSYAAIAADSALGGYDVFLTNAARPAPTVAWSPGSETGVEGGAITLGTIVPSGSTLSSVLISGLPAGATLTDGTHSFTATAGTLSANVLGWNDAALSLTAPDAGQLSLSVQATDGFGDVSNVATEAVTADPLAPAVAPVAVSGTAGQAIALNLGIAANGLAGDSNSLSSVTLSGLPSGATLSNTAGNTLSVTGGSITFSAAQLAAGVLNGLAVTPASAGTFTLTVAATEQDHAGDLSAATTGTEAVTANSAPTSSAVPAYSHIVVVMEENHNYDEIIGNTAEAPFLNSLANGGAVLANYHAITHPSQPNYFALYAGSTFGTTDDNTYSEPDPTLGTILQADGKTFMGYVDQSDSDINHNPWQSFPEGYSVQTDFGPTTADPSFTSLFPSGNYSSLPTVSFVIPGIYNDMHSGTIQQGDSWLQSNLAAYAQWAQANNSLLIVTWDENDDDGSSTEPSNQVPAILYGAGVVAGTYTADYNHYDTLSTILAAYGLAAPNNAATAATIQAFAGDGETVSTTITGPVVLSANDNPLVITAAGEISSTGAGADGIDGPAGEPWAIENDGTVLSAAAIGISLAGGGSVSNGTTSGVAATISGGLSGIAVSGAAANIINDGRIIGVSNDGVLLAGAATPFVYGVSAGSANSVTNAAGASIAGGINGVYIGPGTTGTVTNSGSIGASGGAGVGLAGGGSVSNAATGTISASGTLGGGFSKGAGVFVAGATGSVTNDGQISGAAYGVSMADGGSVTNAAAILGGEDGVIIQNAAGTLTNDGSIIATVDDGAALFTGGSVTNAAGGLISGEGAAAAGVYVTGQPGIISNAGSIVGSNDVGIMIESGGSIGNSTGGSIAGLAEGVFFKTDAGTLANAGSIDATGTNGAGVYLENAGGVTNLVGGSVSGGAFGVFLEGGFSTLANYGAIRGVASDGVVLGLGGSVTNAAGATIAGSGNGVYVKYRAAGTVTNAGSIGATGSTGAGIDLGDGGSVTNTSSGVISGTEHGVFIAKASGTVSNDGAIAGGIYHGVALLAGGSVENAAGASITGGTNGIYVGAGAQGTITNLGSVVATAATGAGIDLGGGGSVANDAGAAISGGAFGVFANGAAATVTNAGSIAGLHGVGLEAGGSLTNAADAAISGQTAGVFSQGAAATLINSGSITASAAGAAAADIEAGGSITNNAGATLAGAAFGVFTTGGPATVTNAGTISGASYAVKFSGSATNLLVVDPGAVFDGGAGGGGSTNTLELASGTGSIGGINSGTFFNFQTLAVDSGASWTLNGANTAATVLNDGTVAVAGSLDVSTAIDPGSTGLFQLDGGSTLDVAAALGTQTQMSFLGSSDLVIGNFAAFGSNVGSTSYAGPQLQDFASGDVIDLQQFGAAGVQLNYDATTGLLQLANGASQLASLDFQNATLGSGTFHAVTDGGSGILITHS